MLGEKKKISPCLLYSLLLPRAVTPWQGGLAQPLQAAQPALLRTSVSAARSSQTGVETMGDWVLLYEQMYHLCCKGRACRNQPGWGEAGVTVNQLVCRGAETHSVFPVWTM